MHGVALVLFTRSLRLQDNTALNAAIASGAAIAPVFVFTPEQADAKKNTYFSRHAFRYMIETLLELDAEIKAAGGAGMIFMRGDTVTQLGKLARSLGATAIYENIDVTPYARERSHRIQEWAAAEGSGVGVGVEYHGLEDVDLCGMSEGLMESGEMYTVFTAYWRNMVTNVLPCTKPNTQKVREWVGSKEGGSGGLTVKQVEGMLRGLGEFNAETVLRGGRHAAEARLNAFARKSLAEYGKAREYPSRTEATSRLGAAIRFGVLSVREVAWKAAGFGDGGWSGDWIRELVWRSFYYHWMWRKPDCLNQAFISKFDNVPSLKEGKAKTSQKWAAFVEGRTGFPLIDAGVRELQETGWSHNRIRMMLAVFVVRGLGVDWRVGQSWMARQLIDHDVISNCFGWQWGGARAPSAQPYFRIMSPWAQARRFDKECEYIKRWVPELAQVRARDVLRWDEAAIREKWSGSVAPSAYPAPIIDWSACAKDSIALYAKHAKK